MHSMRSPILAGPVCAAIAFAVLATPAVAQALTQPDGTTIPVLNPATTVCAQGGNVQVCLDEEEGGATIDAQAAAAVTPETYTPACSLTFKVIARGAGFRNTFGWYNVVPGSKPPDSDLHAFLECTDDVGATKVLDIRNSPYYAGGDIGFFMASPEGTTGNCPTFDPAGGPVAGTVGYVYYSEAAYNPDNAGAGSYIHLITYNSVTHTNSFYFAWEDLLAGGDNDFEDLLTRVEGIQCTGGGEPCDTGFDGQCSFGTMQCRNGVLECVQNEQPGTEACNGVDDDCNGAIDDGDLCTGDEICYQGKCVPPCGGGEFTCPPSTVCNADGICVDPACETVTCGEGEICVDGACQGWCDGVQCPYGQVCRVGVCVDPCDEVTCDADYYCDMGVCVIRCTCGQCPPGDVCDESIDQCVSEGCEGVACNPGEHCEGGVCVDDCQGAACPAGQVCEQGECVASDADAGVDGGGGNGGGLVDGGLSDGGVSGSGGADASGTSGTGGFSGDYSGGEASSADDDGGCGCRVPASPRDGAAWVLVGLALAALRRRRRGQNR